MVDCMDRRREINSAFAGTSEMWPGQEEWQKEMCWGQACVEGPASHLCWPWMWPVREREATGMIYRVWGWAAGKIELPLSKSWSLMHHCFFFFFTLKKIFGCTGSLLRCTESSLLQVFSSCGEQWQLSSSGMQASHCSSSSCHRAWTLGCMGSVVVMHGLSCPMACGS